ncbi:MAG: HsdR family type I site-specific deoxyribonuclease [Algibacter sp.]|uniref:type I restriction endonuclease subunit R n=1 Tax=Algibacter sp. TaxID=1872428 RepID=UPI00260D7247|nr:HsdR family type I site-specific deoxyribonuclease [Algibacter sp.]MDG1728964.1 HsdR family type I site-specific deoxyribonuclease [Algibacter sp.]MDG2177202.1 HsdR family type I site-specific deoxyribonuclease [Algibacter sp.]
MNTPSFLEDHISQIPAIQLLINMGYNYVSPEQALEWRGGKKSQVLFENVLKTQLKKINSIQRKGKAYEFSESNITIAIRSLKELPIEEGFLNANAAFYDLITLGKAMEQSIDGDKKSHTLQYIDWQNPSNNVFHVTEEYSVLRTGRTDTYRPDIVLFINGIPTVIIECKSPSLKGTKSPTELAIEQHIRNFSKKGIRSLYIYSNLLMSIATNDGGYATTGTSKEFWAKWKEQFANKDAESNYWNELKVLKNEPLKEAVKDVFFAERTFGFNYVRRYFDGLEQEERPLTKQDELLYSLCRPDRIIDIIRNYTLYDEGIKKVARYQQYFAVKDTLKRVTHFDNTGKRQGGVIWHTQGSGKSLTMVMLAQMIASSPEISNPKILLVTDRIDLDDQISDTFKKCQKEVKQAKTGSHLSELLLDKSDAIITTIINKFEAAVKQCKQPFLSPNIFVMIDEGHRTQYGTFNVSMQRVFPNACFLAFTGTPLMKKERSTANKFGGYIGLPYTVKDAVEDGAVVPLLYEGRHNLITVDEDPINRYFDKLSEPLSDYGKANLKRKFNTINELNKTEKVIYARAWDISEHYRSFFQTESDKYKPKAQLVAPSIKTALLYHEILKDIGMVSSEVIVTQSDQREGTEDGFYNVNEEKEREDTYFNAMIDKYGDLKRFEKSVITQFKKREHPEILIVVAKLLTGFDAPNNTVLYLCRSLKEHTLLQAVARVNRVFPGKDYGYIIDYYGNLENLDSALSTYSGLADFDESELEGTLTNLNEEVKKLPQAHSELWDIFKTLKDKNLEPTAYEELLSPEDIRNNFYEKLSHFARLLKMALSSVDFVNNTPEKKINMYKKDALFFLKLRVDVKRRYNDDLSYKEYEPQIQKLINKHISTEGEIMKVTELVNIFDKEEREAEIEKITGKAAQADHISSRTIKAINVKMQEDPVYYKKLADLIKETIEEYYLKRITEAEFLKRAKEHEDRFLHGRSDDAPEELANNDAALAFYNFSKSVYEDSSLLKTPFHIEVSLAIDNTVKAYIYLNGNKIIEWHKNNDITGKINIELGDALYELLRKFDLDTNWKKIDHLIEECMKVAILKYK